MSRSLYCQRAVKKHGERMMTIPDTAQLQKEEAGVKWYSEQLGHNTLHFMIFNGRLLQGSWVGPHWIFWALTTMSLEEREKNQTVDEWMGAIRVRIEQRPSK